MTPRASSSVPRSQPKQTRLDLSATGGSADKNPRRAERRRSALVDRERGNILSPERSASMSRSERDRLDDALDAHQAVDDASEAPSADSRFKDIFRRASKPATARSSSPATTSGSRSSSKGSHGLGRTILAAPARRGPSIEFDRDLDENLSASQELLGEADRKKRRRVEGSVASGKLEMCDIDEHGGFGSPEKPARSALSRKGASSERTPRLDLEGRDSLPQRALSRTSQQARRGLPSAPRAPSPRKRSRASPQPSEVLVAATPSPTSSGSSSGFASRTALALQAQLVPYRASRPAQFPNPDEQEPVLLVPESDPPEEEEGSEPSTLESSGERTAPTPRRAGRPDPGLVQAEPAARSVSPMGVAPAPTTRNGPQRTRRADDSGFSEGGVLLVSDEATPRAPPKRTGARIDLTQLPTSSSPTVPLKRRPLRDTAVLDDEEDGLDALRIGGLDRTASGLLMPPPPLPISPQKRRTRLRKGAPSTRSAAEEESQRSADLFGQSAAVRQQDDSPPETVLDETQYLRANACHSDSATRAVDLDDSYPWLFAHVPRPNMAAGYTPIRFAAEEDVELPTPHPKESPLLHKQPTSRSSPIREPVRPPPAHVAPIQAERLSTESASARADGPRKVSGAGWDAAVAPAWTGARPASPNAPRQARLAEFFAVVPNSQAHGGEQDAEVEDSQAGAAAAAAAAAAEEEAVLLRAVMQMRPRMDVLRTSTTPRRGTDSTDAAADAVAAQVDNHAPISSEMEDTRGLRSSRPGRKVQSPGARLPIPIPTDLVDDSDPEDDAHASPYGLARVTRTPSVSPVKRSLASAGARCGQQGAASPLGQPRRRRFPRYSPGKLRQALERHGESVRASVQPASTDGLAASAPEPEAQTTVAIPTAAGGGAEETQWESYWSYPTAMPSPEKSRPSVDDDEEDAEEAARLRAFFEEISRAEPALPEGWTRDECGELIPLGEDRWDLNRETLAESQV